MTKYVALLAFFIASLNAGQINPGESQVMASTATPVPGALSTQVNFSLNRTGTWMLYEIRTLSQGRKSCFLFQVANGSLQQSVSTSLLAFTVQQAGFVYGFSTHLAEFDSFAPPTPDAQSGDVSRQVRADYFGGFMTFTFTPALDPGESSPIIQLCTDTPFGWDFSGSLSTEEFRADFTQFGTYLQASMPGIKTH